MSFLRVMKKNLELFEKDVGKQYPSDAYNQKRMDLLEGMVLSCASMIDYLGSRIEELEYENH